MPAGLLERRDDLRVLRAALDRARSGNGGAALVAGEAGIGKTSLVRRFVAELPGDVRVLVGVCDLLGALSGTSPATLRLAPLSPEAVDELARRAGRDGASVHAVTGGNPFFATELLA